MILKDARHLGTLNLVEGAEAELAGMAADLMNGQALSGAAQPIAGETTSAAKRSADDALETLGFLATRRPRQRLIGDIVAAGMPPPILRSRCLRLNAALDRPRTDT